MRQRAAALLAALAVGGLAQPARAQTGSGYGSGYANPSAVIAAESELDRLARAKGENAALRATAAANAIVFVPARMLAAEWLKHRADPVTPANLQPVEVWSSCDGSYVIARGAWHRGAAGGPFVTLWQHQPKGGYKWLLDLRSVGSAPSDDLDLDTITGKVAPCGARSAEPSATPGARPRKTKPHILQPSIDPAAGRADDGTLGWTATLDATGAGAFVVSTVAGTTTHEVMRVPIAGAAG